MSKRAKLLLTAINEEKLLMQHGVRLLTSKDDICSVNAVDETAKELLNMYHPVNLMEYIPLETLGDGNSFL